MADQGTQVAADNSLRSILRALDEEDGELMPLQDHDPDWHAFGVTSGRAVACTDERPVAAGVGTDVLQGMETVGRGIAVDGSGGGSEVARRSHAGTVVILAMAGVLSAGAFVMPTPNGEWARAALEELLIEASHPVRLASAAGSKSVAFGETVPAGGEPPQRGLQAFAEMAQRALMAATANEVGPSPAPFDPVAARQEPYTIDAASADASAPELPDRLQSSSRSAPNGPR